MKIAILIVGAVVYLGTAAFWFMMLTHPPRAGILYGYREPTAILRSLFITLLWPVLFVYAVLAMAFQAVFGKGN